MSVTWLSLWTVRRQVTIVHLNPTDFFWGGGRVAPKLSMKEEVKSHEEPLIVVSTFNLTFRYGHLRQVNRMCPDSESERNISISI